MLSNILKNVLVVIKPSKNEIKQEKEVANTLLKKLKRFIPKSGNVVVAGSIAKSTFLADSRDIDLFILLPKNIEKKKFGDLVKKVVESAFPLARYELKYAEHPYARVYLEGKRIDVVPAYKINDARERISAVDRSVLHTQFVVKKLRKKQIDGVLLLKKFLKANELYGAEIKIEGFSGYLCELLILKYGNFIRTIRAAAKWNQNTIVDTNWSRMHKKEMILEEFKAPLVVIDPVDAKRNVAAALSKENLKKISTLAKRFLKTPSINFFLRKPLDLEEKIERFRKKGCVFFSITLQKPKVVEDILWGQLKKLRNSLLNNLKINDFETSECHLEEDEQNIFILLLLKKAILADKKEMKGPLLSMNKDAERFKKAHKKDRVFTKNKRLFALVKRKMRTASDAIKRFFRTAVLPSHFNRSIKLRVGNKGKT